MEDILLSFKQYQALIKRLDEINEDVTSLKRNPGYNTNYIDNADLMALLHVSIRTALRWRSTGRLPFVKIARKLYYPADIILNSFRIRIANENEVIHPPPEVPQILEENPQTGCERCPLFLILNA